MLFHLIFSPRRSLGTLSAEHIILLLCAELITTGLSGEDDSQQLIAAGVGSAGRAAHMHAHGYDGEAKDTFAQRLSSCGDRRVRTRSDAHFKYQHSGQ